MAAGGSTTRFLRTNSGVVVYADIRDASMAYLGSETVTMKVYSSTLDQRLEFDSAPTLVFEDSPTTDTVTLLAIDGTELVGLYSTTLDLTAITNLVTDDSLLCYFETSTGLPPPPVEIEVEGLLGKIYGQTLENITTTSGTTGNIQTTVNNIEATVTTISGSVTALNDPSASAVADAVWRELLADHQAVSGSFAETQMLIAGLVQNNFVLDATTYHPTSGLLTAGTMRIFSTGAQVDAATDGGSSEGELATFEVAATLDPTDYTKVLTYRVKKL
jgi:hypothetical protein